MEGKEETKEKKGGKKTCIHSVPPKTSRVLKLFVSLMSMNWNPHRPTYEYVQEIILLIIM